MSARPRDLYEGAGNFSLRSAFGSSQPAATLASVPQVAPSGGQLKFNLGGLAQQQQQQTPAHAAQGGNVHATPPIPIGIGTTQRFPQALNMRFTGSLPVAATIQPAQVAATPTPQPPNISNLSFISMSATTATRSPPSILGGRASMAAKQEQANAQADVMRLTAYVDELTSRLKKSHQKLQDTESQLHRTSQALSAERQQGETTMKAYKSDLGTAHEVEAKLRAELAARPKRSALTESHFMQSVGSVLQDEQREHAASEKLLGLEKDVKGMCDAKVLIESEIGALKELRAKAQSELGDIRNKYEEVRALSAASESEVSERVAVFNAQCKAAQKDTAEAKAAFDVTKVEHAAMTDRITEGGRQEVQLVAAISSLNASKLDAEMEAETTKAELQKMLLEHGDLSSKVSVARESLVLIKDQEKAAQNGLNAAQEKWAGIATTMAHTPCNESTDSLFKEQNALAKAELEGYASKIDGLRTEIASVEEEALKARATKHRIDVAAVELEGYQAKLSQVQTRLAERESALHATTERLQSMTLEVKKQETMGAVPAFQLDSTANVSQSLLSKMGGKAQVMVQTPATQSTETTQLDATAKVRTSVFGAAAPSHMLCCGTGHNAAAIAARMLPACAGLSALVGVDASPQMTLQRVNFLGDRHAMVSDVSASPSEQQDPQATMIAAVVADLKAKLTEVSEQHTVLKAVAPLA